MKGVMKFFLIMFAIVFLTQLSFGDENQFVKENGLPIRNYKTSNIPWETFEESFAGVSEGNALDQALYDIAKNLGSDGVCFGMCVLAGAIYRDHGSDALCRPVGFYSSDTLDPIYPRFRTAIWKYHLRQLGYGAIRKIAELISSGYYESPVKAFEEFKTLNAQKRNPILCISTDISVDIMSAGFHVIFPYRYENSGSHVKLFVYDPSLPYGEYKTWYDNDSNYLDINTTSDNWDYYWPAIGTDPPKQWKGQIFIISGEDCLLPDTNPLNISNLADLVGVVIINKGRISQIEDEDGRRLFVTKADSHISFNEFETDPTKRLREIVPFIPLSGNGKRDKEIYFIYGKFAKSYKLHITDREGYDMQFVMGDKIINVKSKLISKGLDVVEFRHTGTRYHVLNITPKRDSTEYEIILKNGASNNFNSMEFEIGGVALNAGNSACIGFQSAGKSLRIFSDSNILCDIKAVTFKNGIKQELSKRNLAITKNTALKFEPTNWGDLNSSYIKVTQVEVGNIGVLK